MYLYHLTLQKATAITHVVKGNFSSSKADEVVVVRGKVLELLRFNPEERRFVSIFSIDIFGVIRSIQSIRIDGESRDYIIVGSDSGKISILEFDSQKNVFKRVIEDSFGRSGCRRAVPGQYLAVDPLGRAILIGALEKRKFVYILNKDNSENIPFSLSSPIGVTKENSICFDVVGVDVGENSPMFASIEAKYETKNSEVGEITKRIIFYEVDKESSNVVEKWSDIINPSSNLLIALPKGKEGSIGGVLVCAENFVYWKNIGAKDVQVEIPKRKELNERGGKVLIISHTICKKEEAVFVLLQSEFGDLYQLNVIHQAQTVTKLIINYFDSVPVANAITFLQPSLLFIAAEAGNHMLYQFNQSKDEEMELSDDTSITPRPLANLKLIEELQSLTPILSLQVMDATKETSPQIITTSGTSASSSLRILRHGLEVNEIAMTSLPSSATSIWSIKKTANDLHDSFIVVSFNETTSVLSIGSKIEEVSEEQTGIITSSPSLNIRQMGTDGLLQVLPTGLRYISVDKKISEWRTPGKKQIVRSAVNQKQVVISLSGGEIYYFKVDFAAAQLIEVAKKELGHEISCIDIAPVPHKEKTEEALYLAVGDWDGTVHILSLHPDDCLQTLSIQSLLSQPFSLSFASMKNESDESSLFLYIGMKDGILLRILLDELTGELSDVRRRFLGNKAVKLIRINVNGSAAVLAISSRSWISYNYQSKLYITPLSVNVSFDSAANFSSEDCNEGIVTVNETTLRVISIERLGEIFNQKETKLKYTPRKFILHPPSNHIITIETDYNSVLLEKEDEEKEWINQQRIVRKKVNNTTGSSSKWASSISLISPITKKILHSFQLKDNEAAFSICSCSFNDRKNEWFVIVGVARRLTLTPRKNSGGFIYVFQVVDDENGSKFLNFIHRTRVEEVPGALCPFQGRLLAGVGNELRIYDIGMKKLLRKCENKNFPTLIKSIHAQGDRIIVGDMSESFHFVKYRTFENQLFIFADDQTPRWITARFPLPPLISFNINFIIFILIIYIII